MGEVLRNVWLIIYFFGQRLFKGKEWIDLGSWRKYSGKKPEIELDAGLFCYWGEGLYIHNVFGCFLPVMKYMQQKFFRVVKFVLSLFCQN